MIPVPVERIVQKPMEWDMEESIFTAAGVDAVSIEAPSLFVVSGRNTLGDTWRRMITSRYC